MWKQGETRMGGCFLSSGTAHKHTHTITNNNDPAKTSQQQIIKCYVIKCSLDCCVHYSNAVMHSQRWVFRNMPSLINQSEPL